MSDITNAQAVLTESHVVMEAGTFEVAFADAQRALSHLELKPPVNLAFRWHGMHFTVLVEQVDHYFRLSLKGDIAVLPYSAENSIARSKMLRLADSASDCGANRFFVSCHQRITYYAETSFSAPLDRAAVIGRTVTMLLAAKPQLDGVLAESAAPPNWAARGPADDDPTRVNFAREG